MSFEALYAKISPGIVCVHTHGNQTGTGFFVDVYGLAVTNHHVVQGFHSVIVENHAGYQQEARVVRSFKKQDLAFLLINQVPSPYLELGDSGSLRVGQEVVAVGFSKDRSSVMARGIVNSIGRYVQGGHYLQTDVQLDPASTGGPLLDLYGRVVGMNARVPPASPIPGLAVAINDIKTYLGLVLEKFQNLASYVYCVLCGDLSPPSTRFCTRCGTTLPEEKVTASAPPASTEPQALECDVCKAKFESRKLYCPKCGATLSKK